LGRLEGTLETLDDWLSYQENLHTKEIDLGLERVQKNARLQGISPNKPIESVINPGVSSNIPDTIITTPSNISNDGLFP
jgi:hypothetical protein